MNNPWEEIDPPIRDVSARRIDHTHPLDLYWAKDYLGRYLFVYEVGTSVEIDNVNLPDLVGIQTAYLGTDSGFAPARLVLVLSEQSNWELFVALSNDLVEATRFSRDASSAVRTILRRLARWQDFLKKHRSDLLSEERIIGLIGELLFLKTYLIPCFGPSSAIQFWRGPEGHPQDFNVHDSAIEVKCQSGATKPTIKISSVEQLCPQFPEMYLYVITLGTTTQEDPMAINLPGLVSHLRTALVSENNTLIERFNDLLYMVGYLDTERYLDYCYLVSDEKMFRITDDFPRVCSSDIRPGIINLSYFITLDACAPFVGKPEWMVTAP